VAWIKAFGSYLPERVVTNAELGATLGADPDWIVKASGIEERRFASASETVVDLAVRAAENCLSAAAMPASELGMLIVASGSAERQFPGPAASVAHRLGLAAAPALDLPMASAGSLFGMALAGRLAEAHGPILVIGSEILSRVVLREPVNRDTAILFGDGAGACLVTPDGGFARILDSLLATDGSFAESLRLEFNQALAMDGRTVILQAARKIPRAIEELLKRNNLTPQQAQVFLLHQANLNLILKVAQTLRVSESKFSTTVRRHGNTSSASMLIAADDWWQSARIEPGQPIVFAAFGAGFHWGALVALAA
jgi:3-oxoacyl-[acyl-carrier-protein] synthase-3